MNAAMKSKQEIRDAMQARRAALEPEWIAASSDVITRHALALPQLSSATVVAVFLSLRGEPDTAELIRHLWNTDKRVCVPARDASEYRLAWLDEDTAIESGPFRVPQPVTPQWTGNTVPDLLFVPGVAFDRQGNRLGHGRGYYDRMLAPLSGLRVGLAFDFQRIDPLPVEPHDLPMQVVVTETGSHRP